MKRSRDDRPADICFARGTFNAHPHVMGALEEFLKRLETPEIKAVYANADSVWGRRADTLNQQLEAAGLNLEVRNLQSIWTLCYTQPYRYNWLLQYYLRAAGLFLSWVGTGRFIFSLDYSEADFQAVCEKLIAGAKRMEADGFFWRDPALTNKAIRRRVLKEMISHKF
jgi:glutamate-1-semialdehyde 2,1-aminomutase